MVQSSYLQNNQGGVGLIGQNQQPLLCETLSNPNSDDSSGNPQPMQQKKSLGVSSLSKDFKEIAINAMATACDKELLTEAVPKINTRIVGDLSMIQIRESKKRTRPAFLD